MITEDEIKAMADELSDALEESGCDDWGLWMSFCNLITGRSFGMFYGQEDNLGATIAGALISKPELIYIFESAVKVAKNCIKDKTIMLDDFVNNNNNKIKS